MCKVRDDGAGIPREALPRLFDPYYQADNQRRANQKGTGLGLAIVKQIVDMHGGQIDVESVVEQGTTFTVTLPVRAQSALRPPATPSSVGTPPRVSAPEGVASPS
jgi:signal transduction histidine kinase